MHEIWRQPKDLLYPEASYLCHSWTDRTIGQAKVQMWRERERVMKNIDGNWYGDADCASVSFGDFKTKFKSMHLITSTEADFTAIEVEH